MVSHAEVATQSLIGSIWTGDGQSGDGIITYVFHFDNDQLAIESTCHVDEISSTMKSELKANYSENGAVATLNTGLQLSIPTGRGSCALNFPAGLQFQLDHDQIFIEYGGTRRPTKMKRQN